MMFGDLINRQKSQIGPAHHESKKYFKRIFVKSHT